MYVEHITLKDVVTRCCDDEPGRGRSCCVEIDSTNPRHPMRFAYADPPYIGQAKKHYQSEEVDHATLIGLLVRWFPDGWALSCSSPSLKEILPLCPPDVRVMAWVKPFCSFKPNVGVAYAWEPVIVRGGRKRTREQATVRDFVSANITLRRGLSGAKPERFGLWLCEVLNMDRGDTLEDLYPGTGAVTKAWEKYQAQGVLL